MISLIGGKLTTAGCVGREYAEKTGIGHARLAAVATASEVRIHELLEHTVNEVARIAGVGPKSASGIIEWYGPRSREIARMAGSDAKLRVFLCPHTDHIVAEAVDAFENQCAVTLSDVLLRRVPVALGACWSADCTRAAASGIAAAMGWNDARKGAELEQFEMECEAFLQRIKMTHEHSQTGPSR